MANGMIVHRKPGLVQVFQANCQIGNQSIQSIDY